MNKALAIAAIAMSCALWLADATTSDLKRLSHDRHAAILQIGE